MNTKRFSTGTAFSWQGSVYEVKRLLPDGQVNIEAFKTGAVQVLPLRQLIDGWFCGELRFVIETHIKKTNLDREKLPDGIHLELSDYPAYLAGRARFRFMVIEPLLALSSSERTKAVIDNRILEVKAEMEADPTQKLLLRGLSRRSIFRWIRKYTILGEDLRALIDHNTKRGGRGKSRLDPTVQNLLESVINDLYFKRELVTIDDILCEAEVRFQEENHIRPSTEQLKVPGRATVARRIDALDMRERFAAKHGKRAAGHEFDQVGQMDYPSLPLERVEIDDTKVDQIVIDDMDGLPLGRPLLSYSICTATKYPLGIYLGFEPASYYSVMETLYHSICPKPDVRELFGTDHQWITEGVPKNLVIDNGKHYIGKDLEDTCAELGITLIYSPVRTPQFKATVERGFSTMNTGLFHTIPGTTFSNIFQRGDYDSVGKTVITLSELQKALTIFIVDVYAERFHTGLRGIPARRWEAAIQSGFSPRLPASRDDLLVLLGRVDHRVIQPYGIDFLYIRYNSPELSRLRQQLKGESVKFKYHPGDLTKIFVRDPFDRVYIEIPALDQEYATGLSLWKHRVILDYANQEAATVNLAALGSAKRRIREIVDAARSRKRVSTRSRIARWDRAGQPPSLEHDTSGACNSEPEKPVSPVTPIPPTAQEDIQGPEDDADGQWELDYRPVPTK